jgi:hypothetical protein
MGKYLGVGLLLVGWGMVAGTSAGLSAQNVPGVTGTIAPESTIQETDAAVHRIFGGLKALFRGKGRDDEVLGRFREGRPVALRYAGQATTEATRELDLAATESPTLTEGVVTKIDVKAKTITIKFANGSQDTLRLANHLAADTGKQRGRAADEGTVVVYYADASGRKVGVDFKKAS